MNLSDAVTRFGKKKKEAAKYSNKAKTTIEKSKRKMRQAVKKSVEYIEKDAIAESHDNHMSFLVKSQRSEDNVYKVTYRENKWSCDCATHYSEENTDTCSHVLMVIMNQFKKYVQNNISKVEDVPEDFQIDNCLSDLLKI